MSAALIFGLLEIALKIFKDEREGRFSKKLAKLKKDHFEEMKKEEYDSSNPSHKKGDQSRFRSDLTLSNVMFECGNIAELVVRENSKN